MDPACGWCKKWVALLRKAGYAVTTHDNGNSTARTKARIVTLSAMSAMSQPSTSPTVRSRKNTGEPSEIEPSRVAFSRNVWPGTLASLWQQVGRAGRSSRDALAVLVARDDPLDSYLVHHPAAVFGRPIETTELDPANP